MRTSPLSNLDMSHFKMNSGLEDFDEPLAIEGDVVVAEAVQDLRRSQAEIAVIGEVRKYLTENRTSMNEVKAIELRARVLDAVTAGQLRVNPVSVLADDTSYNSPASVQYVDAGLESIPGMIMKGIKFLIDLIVKGYKFLRQLMNSARVRLAKYEQRQNTIEGIIGKSKNVSISPMRSNGEVITLDPETKGVLNCLAILADHDGNEITAEAIRSGIVALNFDMVAMENKLIKGFVTLATDICRSISTDYGEVNRQYIKFEGNVYWLQESSDKQNGRWVSLATDNYANEGRFVIRGDVAVLMNPRDPNLLDGVGFMVPSVLSESKANVSHLTFHAPTALSTSTGLLTAVKALSRSAIVSDLDSKLSAMEKDILKATQSLSQRPASPDYVTEMTMALTSCASIAMDGQRYRINTIDRVCLAVDKYFQACMV